LYVAKEGRFLLVVREMNHSAAMTLGFLIGALLHRGEKVGPADTDRQRGLYTSLACSLDHQPK
jgi:hypothetical protein